MAIGSLMVRKMHEMMAMLRLITRVQMMLSFLVNLRPLTSSIESFIGKTQKGTANVTTTIMPNKAMKIGIGVLPLLLWYGAARALSEKKSSSCFFVYGLSAGPSAKATYPKMPALIYATAARIVPERRIIVALPLDLFSSS